MNINAEKQRQMITVAKENKGYSSVMKKTRKKV